MSVIAVIPARYGSTRYPGKPLLRETGKYLIQHVCERVLQAASIGRCIVATDDARIEAAVASFGGEVRMTRVDHVSGTDRIEEVCVEIGAADDDLILNVQGDEPEIEPGDLDRLVARMQASPAVRMGTLACPFPADRDPKDPNCVKVVKNCRGTALYFSRALIPYPRDADAAGGDASWLLHLGIYAYRRAFLREFAGWPPGALEQVERLEQLRALERGCEIVVETVARAFPGVDTPADYREFVSRWAARG